VIVAGVAKPSSSLRRNGEKIEEKFTSLGVGI